MVDTYEPQIVTDPVQIEGYSQGTVSISGTGAQSAALEIGQYDLWSDVDCWIKIAEGTASDVTSSTGYLLRANNTITFDIRDQRKIGAIAGGAGTLRYHKVG
jgi:hypothetical protein